MKVALGIIARPVESLLVLCLRPIISHFDGLVMLTSIDQEWGEEVNSLVHAPRGFTMIADYVWKHDYAHARNTLIAQAEKSGYDWLLMLDADESMLPDDLIVMRKYMETEESLIFSRYEFVDDFEHFIPALYPDYQVRAFKLNMSYNYTGKVHEYLRKGVDKAAHQSNYSTLLPMIHIFHYVRCKPSEEVWLKFDTYNQLEKGFPPRTRPVDNPLPESWAIKDDKPTRKVKFIGNKPL